LIKRCNVFIDTFWFVSTTHSYCCSIKRTISTAWVLHKIVSPPFRNFVGRLSLRPLETWYRVASETRIRKKSTWTTRTNGRIRLDSRRLNGDRKRVGSRTKVEARKVKQIAAKKTRRANIAVDFSSNAAIKGTNLTSLFPSGLLFQLFIAENLQINIFKIIY